MGGGERVFQRTIMALAIGVHRLDCMLPKLPWISLVNSRGEGRDLRPSWLTFIQTISFDSIRFGTKLN